MQEFVQTQSLHFAPTRSLRARVVNHVTRFILRDVASPYKDHRVKRHSLLGPVKEQQITNLDPSHIPSDTKRVEVFERRRIGELREGSILKVRRFERARPRAGRGRPK